MNEQPDSRTSLPDLVEKVNTSDIASIRNIAAGILRIVNDIRSTPKDLEDLIKLDPPLVAKVLKTANSAYYSPPHRIDSIEQAIHWIGFDMLKFIALGQKVRDIFNQDKEINGFSRPALWQHSVAVGLLGKMIYNEKIGKGGENIYTAGLIHEIGIIAIEQFIPDRFNAMLRQTADDGVNLDQVESTTLGFDHAELAGAITNRWGLPEELVATIRYHHDPIQKELTHQTTTAILYLADRICIANEIGYSDTPRQDDAAFRACMNRVKLSATQVDDLVERLSQEMAAVREQGLF